MCLLYTFYTVLNNAWDANIEVVCVTVSIHDVYTGDGIDTNSNIEIVQLSALCRVRIHVSVASERLNSCRRILK